MPAIAIDPDLIALTDQCVMCGLCQPQCPTYRLDQHESESPRGRIAIARKLADGSLKPTATTLTHLDHCLGCLSCQKVCPSQVQYEQILIRTRALIAPLRQQPSRLHRWLTNPEALRRIALIAANLKADRWLPRLKFLFQANSLAGRLLREMPRIPQRHSPLATPRARNQSRGKITLFRGCVATVFDRDTLSAATRLLEAAGYQVLTADKELCCGALALHAGNNEDALEIARATRDALEKSGGTTVLVSASGCLGSLRDQTMAGSTLRVDDIMDFLVREPGFDALRFSTLAKRAALHLPCTQMSVGGGSASIRKLLARIPQLELLSLPEQPRCCGAAGSYFLDHPQRADRLRSEKLDHIATVSPDLLLTSNIGCRLFLGNGLRQRDSVIPVLHPLTLLAQQLETCSR